MNELITFFLKNKEWLFSGIGVVMITAIISSIKSLKKYEEPRVFNINLSKDNTRDLGLKLETKKMKNQR